MSEKLTMLKCPECRGPMTQIEEHGPRQWRCRVGHKYSPATMYAAHSETIESTLWKAVVALEEGAEMADTLKQEFPNATQQLQQDRSERLDSAKQIREIIERLTSADDGFQFIDDSLGESSDTGRSIQ